MLNKYASNYINTMWDSVKKGHDKLTDYISNFYIYKYGPARMLYKEPNTGKLIEEDPMNPYDHNKQYYFQEEAGLPLYHDPVPVGKSTVKTKPKTYFNYVNKEANGNDLWTASNVMQAFMGAESGWVASDPYNDTYWIRTKARWNPDKDVWDGSYDKYGNKKMVPIRSSSTAFGPGQATEQFMFEQAKTSPAMRKFWNTIGRDGYKNSRIHGTSEKNFRAKKFIKGYDKNYDYGGNWGGISQRSKELYLQGMYDAYGSLINKFSNNKYASDRDRLYAMAKHYHYGADPIPDEAKFNKYVDEIYGYLTDAQRAKYSPKPLKIENMPADLTSDHKHLVGKTLPRYPYTGYVLYYKGVPYDQSQWEAKIASIQKPQMQAQPAPNTNQPEAQPQSGMSAPKQSLWQRGRAWINRFFNR